MGCDQRLYGPVGGSGACYCSVEEDDEESAGCCCVAGRESVDDDGEAVSGRWRGGNRLGEVKVVADLWGLKEGNCERRGVVRLREME